MLEDNEGLLLKMIMMNYDAGEKQNNYLEDKLSLKGEKRCVE